MDELIEAGRIVNTHGLRGELKIMPWCDSPEVLCEAKLIYIEGPGTPSVYRVDAARIHRDSVLLKVSDIDSVEQAERLKNKKIFLERSYFDLPEGTYFIRDLIGCKVYDEVSGELYGVLTAVTPAGSKDVYTVSGERGELLFPAIAESNIKVYTDEKRITLRAIEGLLD